MGTCDLDFVANNNTLIFTSDEKNTEFVITQPKIIFEITPVEAVFDCDSVEFENNDNTIIFTTNATTFESVVEEQCVIFEVANQTISFDCNAVGPQGLQGDKGDKGDSGAGVLTGNLLVPIGSTNFVIDTLPLVTTIAIDWLITITNTADNKTRFERISALNNDSVITHDLSSRKGTRYLSIFNVVVSGTDIVLVFDELDGNNFCINFTRLPVEHGIVC